MKKLTILAAFGAALFVAAEAGPSLAAVNCGIVQKDLERGKTPQDIAERMAISVDDVNACKGKDEKATTAAGTPPGQANTAPKGATPPAVGEKAKQ